jgi:transcriptional regulator with XRE-family HTH domain
MARLKKGLSQQEVGEATGISQPRIAQIELGRLNVTLETVARIAIVVDRDPVLLLTPRVEHGCRS